MLKTPKLSSFLFILPLALLLAGCSREETHQGVVKNYYSIAVEAPTGIEDPSFRWDLVRLPEKSLLSFSDLVLAKDGKEMTFQPDQAGDYHFELTVFNSEGDPVTTQTYTFLIEDLSPTATIMMAADTGEVDVASTSPEDTGPLAEIDEEGVASDTGEWVEAEVVVGDTEEVSYGVFQKEDRFIEIPSEEAETAFATAEPEQKKEPEAPSMGSLIPRVKGMHTIQFSSWPTLQEAQMQTDELRIMGLDAYVQRAYFEGTDEVWYRVRVGSFSSYDAASQAVREIEALTGLNSWVDYVRVDY